MQDHCFQCTVTSAPSRNTVDHAFNLRRPFAYYIILKFGHDAGDFYETSFCLIDRSIRIGTRAGVCSTQGDHPECPRDSVYYGAELPETPSGRVRFGSVLAYQVE